MEHANHGGRVAAGRAVRSEHIATPAAVSSRVLRRDLRELEASRRAAIREAERFSALARCAALTALGRAAQRLARAANRLQSAAAWVAESRALADQPPPGE